MLTWTYVFLYTRLSYRLFVLVLLSKLPTGTILHLHVWPLGQPKYSQIYFHQSAVKVDVFYGVDGGGGGGGVARVSMPSYTVWIR